MTVAIAMKCDVCTVQSAPTAASGILNCIISIFTVFWNKNLAIANRLRVSCAHKYVYGICDNTVTLKSRLRITQGHWKRNHWIDHTRLTISRVIWRWILLEMWVGGHSRSLKMVPFDSLGTDSYSTSIVTMAVSLTISEIFSVKEWPNLEIWVWGRSRSLKMARFDRSCMTLY